MVCRILCDHLGAPLLHIHQIATRLQEEYHLWHLCSNVYQEIRCRQPIFSWQQFGHVGTFATNC